MFIKIYQIKSEILKIIIKASLGRSSSYRRLNYFYPSPFSITFVKYNI